MVLALLLYLQRGVPALIATSQRAEKEICALPDFSNGPIVGFAVSAVFLPGMQKRSAQHQSATIARRCS